MKPTHRQNSRTETAGPKNGERPGKSGERRSAPSQKSRKNGGMGLSSDRFSDRKRPDRQIPDGKSSRIPSETGEKSSGKSRSACPVYKKCAPAVSSPLLRKTACSQTGDDKRAPEGTVPCKNRLSEWKIRTTTETRCTLFSAMTEGAMRFPASIKRAPMSWFLWRPASLRMKRRMRSSAPSAGCCAPLRSAPLTRIQATDCFATFSSSGALQQGKSWWFS